MSCDHLTPAQLRTLTALDAWISELRVCRLELLVFGKANFNPSQPRVPAGRPDGGQWTDQPYPDAIEEAYPEELLSRIPVGTIRNAWRAWRKFTRWRLGRYKSFTRWGNQIADRNWTPEEIEETITKGKKFRAPNNINGGNATRYEYNGRYVVRDDATKEILQIGDKDFKRPPVPKNKKLSIREGMHNG